MNRILIKDFFVEIWKTRKRFLSIFLIVALGCGFFVGVYITGDEMKATLDHYFNDTNYMDIQVISPYGLGEKDIEIIKNQNHVKGVDAGYLYDGLVSYDDSSIVTRFHSYNEEDYSDQFVLVEGRLPEKAGECLAESKDLLGNNKIHLGDTFTVSSGSDSIKLSDYLKGDTYTVVGTVNSPMYFSSEKGTSTVGSGKLDTFVFLPESEFAMEDYAIAYVHGVESQNTFEDDYKAEAKVITDELKQASKERESERFTELEDKIVDAQKTLTKEENKANKELEDAEVKLKDAEEDLAQGEIDYKEGEQEYYSEIAKAEQELIDAKKDIAQGKIDYADGEETYYKEIAKAEQKLKDAEEELRKGAKEQDDGRMAYLIGYDKYLEGKAEFERQEREALPKLEEAKEQLDQADESIGQLVEYMEAYSADLLPLLPWLGLPPEEQEKIEKAITDLPGQITLLKDEGHTMDDSQTNQLLGEINSNLQILSNLMVNVMETMPTLASEFIKAMLKELQSSGYLEGVDIDSLTDEQIIAIVKGIPSMVTNLLTEFVYSKKEYYSGIAQLDSAREQLKTASRELAEADDLLTKAYQKIKDGREELADGKKELEEERIKGLADLKEAKQKIIDGEQEYLDGIKTLEEERIKGKNELDDALVELEDGRQKIADAKVEVADGRIKLTDTIAEYQQDIDDARELVDGITDIKWIVTSRNNISSVSEFGVNAERIDAIAKVFPVFFLAIAILVSLTTMTRMVEDQRTQVGTLKSLGYSNFAISLKFIAYAFLASFFGSIFGLAVGSQLFPRLIYTAFASVLYKTPDMIVTPHWGIMVMAVIVAILTTTLSTFFVSHKMLLSQPASLLRPEAPRPGKRILLERVTPIWSRLSFNQKVTFRNLFRFKRRMLMSIVGIAGCTALTLAGFGLRDSIMGFIGAQFDDVMHYDMEIVFDDEESLGSAIKVIDETDGIEKRVTLRVENAVVSPQNGFTTEQDANLEIFFDPEDIKDIITLEAPKTQEPVNMINEGAVISEKLSKLYSIGVGDTLQIEVEDHLYDVEVSGVTKNYLFHYIYMTDDYYNQLFGSNPKINRELILFDKELQDDTEMFDNVAESLLKEDSVLAVVQTKGVIDATSDLMGSLDTIVFVLIVSAGLLAFIVMYNLTNINITERKREIASLKVLGFYDLETTKYITGENIILSIIGAGFGLGLGYFLAMFITSVAEVDNMMFLKEIKPMSFVYAFAITMVFTFIVSIAAHFQLKKIDMIESLQSVE